jgi:hypothetical protein
MYKKGDIVLVRSIGGDTIPKIHVELIEQKIVKPQKGKTMDWPGYIGWKCVLTKPEEADILRKEWSIPFRFPDDIETFVLEENIIKKIKTNNARKRKNQKTKIQQQKKRR